MKKQKYHKLSQFDTNYHIIGVRLVSGECFNWCQVFKKQINKINVQYSKQLAY